MTRYQPSCCRCRGALPLVDVLPTGRMYCPLCNYYPLDYTEIRVAPVNSLKDQIAKDIALIAGHGDIVSDRKMAETGVRILLHALGENPDREGLQDTPKRMAAMLFEMCRRDDFAFTTFDAEGMSQMIVQTNIPLYSLCEHHVLPFMGTAVVAYIPDGKIVGLSKLARAVKFCSRGLQNQERITRAIADMLQEHLQPKGIGVVLKARHLCMELRGACVPNVHTTTEELRGVFLSESSARAEFLALARG